MASFTPISSQSNSLFNNTCHLSVTPSSTNFQSGFVPKRVPFRSQVPVFAKMPSRTAAVVTATTTEMPKRRYPGEAKGFVEEMRFVAMKLHTREQAKEGEKEVKQPEEEAVPKWEPIVDGYLRILVDSKFVYDTLEEIVQKAAYPFYELVALGSKSCNQFFCPPLYAEFQNTGLERSEKLAIDLEWFREQGHAIPEPSSPDVTYAQYLKDLSEKDPQAFICDFYNIFAHSAGGRSGRRVKSLNLLLHQVSQKILEGKDLEFYNKWDGDLSQLLQNVKDKLNKVAESWTREEKNHCLEETEKSFKYLGDILRLILS